LNKNRTAVQSCNNPSPESIAKTLPHPKDQESFVEKDEKKKTLLHSFSELIDYSDIQMS